MSEKIPVNPDILKWARQTQGLELSEVANKMGKKVDTISSWEKGESTPTYIQLEKLAYQVFKRPLALFFFPEPPEEETPGEAFRTLPEYEIKNLSPQMHCLLRQARVMKLNLAELNDNVNPARKKIMQDLKFTPQSSYNAMASKVRDYLGIDLDMQFGWENTDTAFKAWRESLEGHGIFVFKEAFKDDSLSGFCLHDEEFPIIYINNSTARSRQIFSLFHELAHLLLGTGGIDTRDDDYIKNLEGDKRRIEVLCNRFAGAFLVPESDFSRQVSTLTPNERAIRELADKYKVSREVILRKCLDKKLISSDYYTSKSKQWTLEAQNARKKKKDDRIGGSYYRTQGAYLGENYMTLAFKKFYQKKISVTQLADYLGVKVKSIPGMESLLFEKSVRI